MGGVKEWGKARKKSECVWKTKMEWSEVCIYFMASHLMERRYASEAQATTVTSDISPIVSKSPLSLPS